jgi:UDP-4-amino-4,6-dideoxy-N-acetyl-beta-L-altrosamine transaminase
VIPYGKQSISEEDIQAVVEVLRSDYLTQGPVVPTFEQAVADYTGAKYAVAVNSGTSALHIACLSLGLGPSDILWTTPITFVASANCALYCGASVDFVDIEPDTFNLSIELLSKKLKEAESIGRLPKIIVAVHMCGLSCDMEKIWSLSKQYGFKIIEDASHAIGGTYHNHPIGGCIFSDVTIFSFHPVKTITTGEGGMAMTNDEALANKMMLLRSHGITRDPELMTCEPDGPWFYQQIALGFNYRLTDIQAALGLSQLNRLDQFVKIRNSIADEYDRLLSRLPVRSQVRRNGFYSGMHLYVIRLDTQNHKNLRNVVIKKLHVAEINVNIHYIPVHTQPWYASMGFKESDFPESLKYYNDAISLPIYPEIKEEEIKYITGKLSDIFGIV